MSWDKYKSFTAARIGLQRSGGSICTDELLKFRYDHAKARDAVWADCNWDKIISEISVWLPGHIVSSKAKSREEYLLRPDLGRQLDDESEKILKSLLNSDTIYDLAFCIVDGLSPLAISQNFVPFFLHIRSDFDRSKLKIAPVICVKNGRVAIGDQIAEILKAKLVVVLVGERPGLSSVDSIGAYITYNPVVGTTDERRNCISNIRPDGLDFERSKNKLLYLITEAFSKRLTGVGLKDRMEEALETKNPSQIT
jgi:ethanolamine ammonia-lyase small subunit